MTYVDLHTHTFYSDGTDDPKSLVRASKLRGVDVLAITDHDTLNGYFKAREEAAKWNLKLIPGVEVSTEKYHILGLNIDPENAELATYLEHIRESQKKICIERIDLLKGAGVPMSLEKLEETFPKSRLGKYNILMAMVGDRECINYFAKNNKGFSPTELFKFYLKKPGVAGETKGEYDVPSSEAIEKIHNAGGIAVIAHPFKQVDDMSELDELVDSGLDGVEIQPKYGPQNAPFREYAERKGLIITYGSDSHGASFDRPLLGRGENHIENLDEIFTRKNRRKVISPLKIQSHKEVAV